MVRHDGCRALLALRRRCRGHHLGRQCRLGRGSRARTRTSPARRSRRPDRLAGRRGHLGRHRRPHVLGRRRDDGVGRGAGRAPPARLASGRAAHRPARRVLRGVVVRLRTQPLHDGPDAPAGRGLRRDRHRRDVRCARSAPRDRDHARRHARGRPDRGLEAPRPPRGPLCRCDAGRAARRRLRRVRDQRPGPRRLWRRFRTPGPLPLRRGRDVRAGDHGRGERTRVPLAVPDPGDARSAPDRCSGERRCHRRSKPVPARRRHARARVGAPAARPRGPRSACAPSESRVAPRRDGRVAARRCALGPDTSAVDATVARVASPGGAAALTDADVRTGPVRRLRATGRRGGHCTSDEGQPWSSRTRRSKSFGQEVARPGTKRSTATPSASSETSTSP